MNKNYDDIINLPHHVSKKRPHMSIEQRAAQFAPFAALTGYDAAVKEIARRTDNKIELDDNQKEILNNKLLCILDNINLKPEITFIYFVPDSKKIGGKYINKTGIVRKINMIEQYIELMDKSKINIKDIIEIESDILISLDNY